MLKKQPLLHLLYKLEKEQDGFYREPPEIRKWFYEEFSSKIDRMKCNICLDSPIDSSL